MIPLSPIAAAPDGSRTITAGLLPINAAARQQKRPDCDADSGAARSAAWSNRFLCVRSLSVRIS